MRVAIVVLLLAGTRASADTEIHRCLLEDGTIAFQEMRCTERTAEANDGNESTESRSTGEKPVADDDMFDFVNPFDEPARPRRPPNQSCPNRYRRTAPMKPYPRFAGPISTCPNYRERRLANDGR